jgi:hypothetical protein
VKKSDLRVTIKSLLWFAPYQATTDSYQIRFKRDDFFSGDYLPPRQGTLPCGEVSPDPRQEGDRPPGPPVFVTL